MKNIKVCQRYYKVNELYQVAAESKPRRALFGYMMETGRLSDTILGGAMDLLIKLEENKGKLYKLVANDHGADEIIAVAEVALAGGLDRYALNKRFIQRTTKHVKRLELQF